MIVLHLCERLLACLFSGIEEGFLFVDGYYVIVRADIIAWLCIYINMQ